MHIWVILLRGINVGGHNKVPMKPLVAALAAEGMEGVQYYIQSGNLVWKGLGNDTEIQQRVQKVLATYFQISAEVLALEGESFRSFVDNHHQKAADNKEKYFLFQQGAKPLNMHEVPDQPKSEGLLAAGPLGAYLYCPEGYSRTKWHPGFLEKKTGAVLTARNYNTCQRLIQLIESYG